ncbi:MAG: phage tail sheath family protein, partial [Chloroflexi bacterium]
MKIRSGSVEEGYENVSLGRRAAKNVTEVLQASKLVMVIEEQTQGSLAERMPEAGTYFIRHQEPKAEGLPLMRVDDFAGDVSERSGMQGLEIADDVTMVCCPDVMANGGTALDKDAIKAVQLKMIALCENLGDRVAIIDAPPDLTPQQVSDW